MKNVTMKFTCDQAIHLLVVVDMEIKDYKHALKDTGIDEETRKTWEAECEELEAVQKILEKGVKAA